MYFVVATLAERNTMYQLSLKYFGILFISLFIFKNGVYVFVVCDLQHYIKESDNGETNDGI